ncbi:MAG: hypothetical protein ABR920_19260 [Terriglobales bacterium]
MSKERLEAWLKVLDILLIAFGIFVAVGVTGEDVFGWPRFGVVVAIGVTAEAVLSFLHVRKSHQLQAIQESEIASIKRDAAEANRLAEQDRLARVKIEERLAPRFLTEKDQSSAVAALKPFASRLVDIVKYPDDAEVSELARQISGVLTDAGWKPAVSVSGEPLTGIVVEIDPKNPPNLTAGQALVTALSGAGLNVKGPVPSLHTAPTGGSVRVTVGRK